MRRITVDEVRAACQATGYRLVQGVTVDTLKKWGCPFWIIVIHRTGGTEVTRNTFDSLETNGSYVFGLMSGFDGVTGIGSSVDYRLGYADGIAIRNTFLPVA